MIVHGLPIIRFTRSPHQPQTPVTLERFRFIVFDYYVSRRNSLARGNLLFYTVPAVRSSLQARRVRILPASRSLVLLLNGYAR